MPYDLEPVHRDCFLGVALTGDVTIGDLDGVRRETEQVLETTGWTRLFVDGTRRTRTQTATDDYRFTREHGLHYPAGTRIAVLHRAEEAAHSRLIENVARNRGVELCVFDDRGAALAWLLDR